MIKRTRAGSVLIRLSSPPSQPTIALRSSVAGLPARRRTGAGVLELRDTRGYATLNGIPSSSLRVTFSGGTK